MCPRSEVRSVSSTFAPRNAAYKRGVSRLNCHYETSQADAHSLPVLCQPGFPSEIISNPDYDFVPAFQIHFANGARFKLPISPLVARVPFFQRYLDRPPSEQLLDQNITLPHEAPDAFLLFCQWLLGGISAETFASISTERWFSFIVIVDDYKLHTLAREAMVAMITSLAFSPPGAVMLGEVARQFARCYRRARSHGIRFVAVHFIAVSLKHLRRNSILRDPRLAEPRFTDDYFRWQPMTDIRPKNDLVTDMDTAKGDLLQHLLPLLFRVKRLSDVIIDTMYLGNSQDAEEEIRHEIRTYLEIEDD